MMGHLAPWSVIAADPPPLPDQVELAKEARLDLQAVEAAHAPLWVDAVQVQAAMVNGPVEQRRDGGRRH
jgi:hypothetical protein